MTRRDYGTLFVVVSAVGLIYASIIACPDAVAIALGALVLSALLHTWL